MMSMAVVRVRRVYDEPARHDGTRVLDIPGGHGKSLLFLTWAVALALGVRFGQFVPPHPMRVAILGVGNVGTVCAAGLARFGH